MLELQVAQNDMIRHDRPKKRKSKAQTKEPPGHSVRRKGPRDVETMGHD